MQYGSESQGIQANDLSVQPSNSEPLPLVSEVDDILCMLLDGEEEMAKQTSTSKEWSDIVDAAFFSPLPLPIDLACIKDVTSLLQPSSPKKQNTKKSSTGNGSMLSGMEEYSSTDASVFPILPLPLPFPFNFASSDTSIQHDLKEQEDITLQLVENDPLSWVGDLHLPVANLSSSQLQSSTSMSSCSACPNLTVDDSLFDWKTENREQGVGTNSAIITDIESQSTLHRELDRVTKGSEVNNYSSANAFPLPPPVPLPVNSLVTDSSSQGTCSNLKESQGEELQPSTVTEHTDSHTSISSTSSLFIAHNKCQSLCTTTIWEPCAIVANLPKSRSA